MNYSDARLQVFDTVHKVLAAGLIYLSAGNISLRVGEDALAITPGALLYDEMRAEDIAIMGLDGTSIDAPLAPSSEMPMHTRLLREFDDIHAIVHTHSIYALTFAMLGETVPVANTEIYFVGGPIPVAPWACPGTETPGSEAVTLFREHTGLKVVLLRNHGLLAIGANLQDAYSAAYTAERGLQAYYQSLQIGKPILLSSAQIDELKTRYS